MNAGAASGAGELPTLWHLRFSHFNEKARWALDYKGVAHRRRALVPGRHPIRSRRLGGRGTTPLLRLDGEMIGDSTEIVARLEQRNPGPPLYPDTEIERNAALELEDHFDEALGPQIRSAVFAALLADRKLTLDLTMQGLPGRERVIAASLWPVLRKGIRRSLPADAEAGRRGREATVAALDQIESELEGDYLVGGRFSVADMTAAALLFPLVAPPSFPTGYPRPGLRSGGSSVARSPTGPRTAGCWRCTPVIAGAPPPSRTADYQPSVPGSPLCGPPISSVTQPP